MKKQFAVAAVIALIFLIGCEKPATPTDTGFSQSQAEVKEAAPGCSLGAGISGCTGKSIITNLMIDPDVGCVKITPNNCNGGVLEIENSCDSSFVIGGFNMPANSSAIVELVKENGAYRAKEARGNFANYYPDKNEDVGFTAQSGSKKIKVSLVKTAKLC